MIYAAILGYGTVGGGIAEVIETNRKEIEARVGDSVRVKKILDLRKFPGDKYEKLVTDDFSEIENDREISVVCETMGGIKPAYDYTKRCLLAGKSVCTSNKAVVAEYGTEFMQIANENHCHYLFEASVGGGIPIIRTMNESLASEKIESITGILNGTTNYILSKMERDGMKFEDALSMAQSLGYAERNPEADVEGYDAARKIAILSSIAYGNTVSYTEIYTEGISKITKEDFTYAKRLHATIKLFGKSTCEDGQYRAMVAPFLIFDKHPLFSVNDAFNGILVHGNTLGDAMFYGSGAGKLPTASAVVADVIEIARNLGRVIPCDWQEGKIMLSSNDTQKYRFFVRTTSSTSEIEKVFGEVSLMDDVVAGEVGFVTAMTEESVMKKLAEKLNIVSMIRIDDRAEGQE